MKINFTIELDKESTEAFQTPFNNIAEQISNFIKLLEKFDLTVQDKQPVQVKKKKPSKKKNIKTQSRKNTPIEN